MYLARKNTSFIWFPRKLQYSKQPRKELNTKLRFLKRFMSKRFDLRHAATMSKAFPYAFMDGLDFAWDLALAVEMVKHK